jgi:amino acid permease
MFTMSMSRSVLKVSACIGVVFVVIVILLIFFYTAQPQPHK